MHGALASGEEFLDDYRLAGIPENFFDETLPQSTFCRGKILRDGHALAESETVGLDDERIVLSAD